MLPRPALRRVAAAALPPSSAGLKDSALLLLAGLAKQHVGALVEGGRRVMAERGEAGALRPCHLREAHRRLALAGRAAPGGPRPPGAQGRMAGRGRAAAARGRA